ncbi:hypothetical protein BB558_003342 [Smittium angustum]|uniref:SGNH hydrolase-type esterase domain-containing protein n=1 Tax=Smittium angustum TaxID=133377 RepID=A0A2U1J6L3_SMIAN|nr:hypothetical protein BB558_003342 [Smittium angustum]
MLKNIGINRICAFGDSSIDCGNVFFKSGGNVPKPPYHKGRFTNGWTWADLLSIYYKAQIINYAHGGATLDNQIVSGSAKTSDGSRIVVPGVKQQISEFISLIPPPSKTTHDSVIKTSLKEFFGDKTLFLISCGSNDLTSIIMPEYYIEKKSVGMTNFTKAKLFANLNKECIDMLYCHSGAKNFLVSNCFPHEYIPFVNDWCNKQPNPETKLKETRKLTKLYNYHLQESLINLKTKYPDINIYLYNSFDFYDRVFTNPSHFGIKESPNMFKPVFEWSKRFDRSTEEETDRLDSIAEGRIWWDSSHITSSMHKLISKDIINTSLL